MSVLQQCAKLQNYVTDSGGFGLQPDDNLIKSCQLMTPSEVYASYCDLPGDANEGFLQTCAELLTTVQKQPGVNLVYEKALAGDFNWNSMNLLWSVQPVGEPNDIKAIIQTSPYITDLSGLDYMGRRLWRGMSHTLSTVVIIASDNTNILLPPKPGRLYFSNTFGNSWNNLDNDFTELLFFSPAVSGTGEVIYALVQSTDVLKIIISKNSGTTWELRSYPEIPIEPSYYVFSNIACSETGQSIVIAYAHNDMTLRVISSSDFGETFKRENVTPEQDATYVHASLSISANASQIALLAYGNVPGFAEQKPTLYISGVDAWTKVAIDPTQWGMNVVISQYSVSILNNGTDIYLQSETGMITRDRGKTWHVIRKPEGRQWLNNSYFFEGGKMAMEGISATNNAEIYMDWSQDYGNTWTRIPFLFTPAAGYPSGKLGLFMCASDLRAVFWKFNAHDADEQSISKVVVTRTPNAGQTWLIDELYIGDDGVRQTHGSVPLGTMEAFVFPLRTNILSYISPLRMYETVITGVEYQLWKYNTFGVLMQTAQSSNTKLALLKGGGLAAVSSNYPEELDFTDIDVKDSNESQTWPSPDFHYLLHYNASVPSFSLYTNFLGSPRFTSWCGYNEQASGRFGLCKKLYDSYCDKVGNSISDRNCWCVQEERVMGQMFKVDLLPEFTKSMLQSIVPCISGKCVTEAKKRLGNFAEVIHDNTCKQSIVICSNVITNNGMGEISDPNIVQNCGSGPQMNCTEGDDANCPVGRKCKGLLCVQPCEANTAGICEEGYHCDVEQGYCVRSAPPTTTETSDTSDTSGTSDTPGTSDTSDTSQITDTTEQNDVPWPKKYWWIWLIVAFVIVAVAIGIGLKSKKVSQKRRNYT